MEPVSVTFAMTRDDCVNAAFARLNMHRTRAYRAAVLAMGVVLLVFGAVLCAMWYRSVGQIQWAGAACVVFGAFLLFLSGPMQEASVKSMAAAAFDRGVYGVAAQNVAVGPEGVEFSSERYNAKIPYAMMCEAYADENCILLCTAPDECRAVPKRTMSPEEQRRAEQMLADHLKQKFKQEGAREWTR